MASSQAPDRVESAADITLHVGAHEIPISRLDTTKEVDINQIREGTLKANGYSITAISFSGSMMFKGDKSRKKTANGNEVDLDDELYDDEGVSKPCTITITHDLDGGDSDSYETVLVTSESYQVRNEDTSETAYDWIAMDRS